MRIKRLFIFLLMLESITNLASCQTPSKRPAQNEGGEYSIPVPKANVNVYVENSMSMDGYVRPAQSVFKSSLHKLLNDINSGDFDSLFVGYINKEIPYREYAPNYKVVSNYSSNLTLENFILKGGDRKTTNFSNIFDKLLGKTNESTVNVLISDFLTDEDPDMMGSNVKSVFKKHLQTNPNLAICVYQLYSNFNGKYCYPNILHKVPGNEQINGDRPYYIWIMGDVLQIEKLRKYKPFETVNEVVMMKGDKTVDYALIKGSGDFELDKKPDKTYCYVNSLRKNSHTKKATFAVYVNLSQFMLDGGYLTDTNSYLVSDTSYVFSIIKPDAIPNRFTHMIKFENNYVKAGQMWLKLKMQLPMWISEFNDNIGTNVKTAMNKTYGLEKLLQGTYDAFTEGAEYYTEIKLWINQ